jgi:hypothetical protein
MAEEWIIDGSCCRSACEEPRNSLCSLFGDNVDLVRIDQLAHSGVKASAGLSARCYHLLSVLYNSLFLSLLCHVGFVEIS